MIVVIDGGELHGVVTSVAVSVGLVLASLEVGD